MMELPNLSDPAAQAALGTGCAALGAGSMRLLEWWGRRGQEQAGQRINSEDLIREDLLIQNRELRAEVQQLRSELADARRELREFGQMHQAMMMEHQKRYGDLLERVAQLQAIVTTKAIQAPS